MNPEEEAKKLAEAGITLEMIQGMQKSLTDLEIKNEEMVAKNAGLEDLFSKADANGETKGLRTKKSYEPKFHTVRLRQYPIAGNIENMGIVAGWTDRGAYQEVDASGVNRQLVDYIDIFFLDQEKTKDGKRKAEKVRLLDLINNGVQLVCKILDEKKEKKTVETGEEINVSIFDPQHGMISTGDTIDGFYTYSDIQYKVSVNGKDVWIDSKFCNQ